MADAFDPPAQLSRLRHRNFRLAKPIAQLGSIAYLPTAELEAEEARSGEGHWADARRVRVSSRPDVH